MQLGTLDTTHSSLMSFDIWKYRKWSNKEQPKLQGNHAITLVRQMEIFFYPAPLRLIQAVKQHFVASRLPPVWRGGTKGESIAYPKKCENTKHWNLCNQTLKLEFPVGKKVWNKESVKNRSLKDKLFIYVTTVGHDVELLWLWPVLLLSASILWRCKCVITEKHEMISMFIVHS